ncbi:MAG: hypothetical protein E2O36_05515 [Proteobacteria bacterium]|nr:MAG: hypothetical protein E2O36_05515 [Pseudomonadota bacterium]
MARAQTLHEVEFDEPTVEASLKTVRQNLNQLRRQARDLDQAALEDCLTLAISLTSTRYTKN